MRAFQRSPQCRKSGPVTCAYPRTLRTAGGIPVRWRPVRLRKYSPLIPFSAPNEEVDAAASSDLPSEEVCVVDEWGENCVKDWSGQRTAAYSSEPEDLGFTALCTVILMLGVGIFCVTRPSGRRAAAQYVTRQPNITLIVEKHSSSSEQERGDVKGSSSSAASVAATNQPRDALEEDSQDFLQTADDIRPMSDLHASLEQQLAPSKPPPSADSPLVTTDEETQTEDDLQRRATPAAVDSSSIGSFRASSDARPPPPLEASTSSSGLPESVADQQLEQQDQEEQQQRQQQQQQQQQQQLDAALQQHLNTYLHPDQGDPATPTLPPPPPARQSTADPTSADDWARPPTQQSPSGDQTPLSAGPSAFPSETPPAPAPQLQPTPPEPLAAAAAASDELLRVDGGLESLDGVALQPSRAVKVSEVQDLAVEATLQNLTERAQIAMRAAAAAGEASHRASAYSAAASSASSKAAEAAERASVAGASAQRALQDMSEEAIAAAEARVARAMELATETEGRAASAAALATAYQDIAQTQAAVAEQVASITAPPGSSAAAAEAASASKGVPNQLLQGLQGQWRLARWQLHNMGDQTARAWAAVCAAVGKAAAATIVVPLTAWWAWLTSQF